jgi:excisionase family DNA binding protein
VKAPNAAASDVPSIRQLRQRKTHGSNEDGGASSPLLLRVRDAAKLLAVSERQVWVLLRNGELRPIRPPGIRALRIARADVEALVARWSSAELRS